jgi:predicted ribosome quality control (RQC) complex YloA/Tae2 family protein
VHNNYYFLRQLSLSLEKITQNGVVSECFSQAKEELIIRFEIAGGSFYIKASVLPSFSAISFPPDFQRTRKNSVDLFPMLIGQRVEGIRQFTNERSFAILFSNGFSLLFKMHGNRANVILFQGENSNVLFKNSIMADETLTLDTLDRQIDWSFENFKQHQDNLPGVYFTFGKVLWQYLTLQNFQTQTLEKKWEMIQQLLADLENPLFYITEWNQKTVLSLVAIGSIRKQVSDPVVASNEFYYTFTRLTALQQEKNAVLSILRARLESNRNFHMKNTGKLQELQHHNNYKMWADLLMANLLAVKPHVDSVTVANFYNNNIPLEIRLRKELSPQKNAAIYYRKSKNQQIEIDRLEQALTAKEGEIRALEVRVLEVEASADLKAIKKIHIEIAGDSTPKKQSAPLPYHEFIMGGFKIWVGRNAQSNDILTLKLSYKDDLWLHAKDVAGSHVLIKYQAGKNFPKDVIERAAQLAAYNSKRKNESLCPVIVTPKKFVRKRKGDPAGVVVVEREEVIMVEPKLVDH